MKDGISYMKATLFSYYSIIWPNLSRELECYYLTGTKQQKKQPKSVM